MILRERYNRLNLWNKIALWGSLASIAGLIVTLYLSLFPAPTQTKNTDSAYQRTTDATQSSAMPPVSQLSAVDVYMKMKDSQLLVNPHNNVAFGAVILGNCKRDGVTVRLVRAALRVASEGKEHLIPLSVRSQAERIRLAPLDETEIPIFGHIAGVSAPVVHIMPVQLQEMVREQTNEGIPTIIFDASGTSESDHMLMFFNDHDRLEGNVELTVSAPGREEFVIKDNVSVYELEPEFCEERFGKAHPLNAKGIMP